MILMMTSKIVNEYPNIRTLVPALIKSATIKVRVLLIPYSAKF